MDVGVKKKRADWRVKMCIFGPVCACVLCLWFGETA